MSDPRAPAAGGPTHAYGFDPTHGYRLEDLLRVGAPDEPADFAAFWRARHAAAMSTKPQPVLRDTGQDRGPWRVFDWSYTSTGETTIRGWALLPLTGPVRRAFLIGHGYSGREAPDFDLEFPDSALFFPCFRGLGRSWHPHISDEPRWHVLHDIQNRDRYVIAGCVEDLWCGVTSVLRLFPGLAGHVGYLGISFGGGVGALAIPWDDRIRRAHLNVPTFGNHPLRLQLATTGSAASIQHFVGKCPEAPSVLRYYDAAVAARHITIPVHCACALFDPAVAPAGQFAIFNALAGPKELFLLTAGHHMYPAQEEEVRELRRKIYNFFADI